MSERDPYSWDTAELGPLVGSIQQLTEHRHSLQRKNPCGFAGTHDPDAGRWPVVPRFDTVQPAPSAVAATYTSAPRAHPS